MLELAFARFYRRLSQWQPPGEGSVYLCGTCFGSGALVEDGVLARFPHAVIHELIGDLLAAVDEVFDEQVHEHEARAIALPSEPQETDGERVKRMAGYARVAEERVAEELVRRLDDIEATRLRYLEPRLEKYVAAHLREM